MNVFLVNPVTGIDSTLTTTLSDLKKIACTSENARTNSEIMELLGYIINAVEPRDRIIRNPNRKNNLVAQIAETAWVLGGRNDLKYLSPFLPRAVDFSDDGKTWRAAYGPRIANLEYSPPEDFFVEKRGDSFNNISTFAVELNQMLNVFEVLTNDPTSRQAYMVVPLPGDNFAANVTRDTPCTLSIQFLIRQDKLHCFVNMRSNDVIWGLTGINFFEWTFLQELLANLLGVGVGVYTHKADSLHIYEKHFTMADKILEASAEVEEFNPADHLSVTVESYEAFERTLFAYFEMFDVLVKWNSPNFKAPFAYDMLDKIQDFATTSNLAKYFAIPLIQLLDTQVEGLPDAAVADIGMKYIPHKYLYEGLLKSNKFFLNNRLNTILKTK